MIKFNVPLSAIAGGIWAADSFPASRPTKSSNAVKQVCRTGE
jgi:hypothetical protein